MKKGQFSLFIIIGIVLLVGALLAIAMFQNWIEFRPPEAQTIGEVPTELKPIQAAVEQCQKRILEEKSRQLLAGGGYLEPEINGVQALFTPYGTGMEVTEGTVIPYWHYIDSGFAKSKQPLLEGATISTIAGQLSLALDEELDACVPWDEFPQYEISKGEPRSEVRFADEQVHLTTYWEIDVTAQTGTTELDGFRTSINAPVKHLYDVATDIQQELQNTQAIEYLTMQMISAYAGKDTGLPPLHQSLDLSNDLQPYVLSQGRDSLTDIAPQAASMVQVLHSRNPQIITSPTYMHTLQQHSMLLTDYDVSETSIHASYVSIDPQDIHLRVNDNPAIAMPSQLPLPGVFRTLMPMIVDNTYLYDVTYPVMLSFEKNGYVLNIGYEVNIEDNEAVEAAEEFEEADSANYCNNAGGAQLELQATDAFGNDVHGADVLYRCGGQACPLGQTTDGALSTRLPSCAAGELELLKDEQFSDIYAVSSSPGQTVELRTTLYEPQEVQLILEQRFVTKVGDIVTLENNIYPAEGDVYLLRQGRPYVAVPQDGTIELVPGTYDVLVVDVEEFETPHPIREEEVCAGLPGFRECETLPRIEFEALPVTFMDVSGEDGVTIETVPDTLRIRAVGLDKRMLNSYDDIDLIDGLFEPEGVQVRVSGNADELIIEMS